MAALTGCEQRDLDRASRDFPQDALTVVVVLSLSTGALDAERLHGESWNQAIARLRKEFAAARGEGAAPIRVCDEHGNATPEFLASADALLRASAGCPTGKNSFPSPQAAMHHAKNYRSTTHGYRRGNMRAYQCQLCKQWHLSRQAPRRSGRK